MKNRQTGAVLRWLALLASIVWAALLFMAAARGIESTPPAAAAWRIDAAEVRQPDGRWGPAALPLHFESPGSATRPTWFRVNLATRPSTPGPNALLVMRTFGRTDVYLNDILVGSGGPLGSSPSHRPPLFLLLPATLSRTGADTLTIRVSGHSTGLGGLHVGPASDLRPAFESALAMKVRGKQIILGVLLGVALMTALLFSLRRSDRHYGWFSLATLAGAVALAASIRQGVDPDHRIWEALAGCTAAWSTVAAALFVNRTLEREPRLLERVLLIGGGALTVATLGSTRIADPSLQILMCHACQAFTIAVSLYLGVGLVRSLQRRWRLSTCLLFVAASLMAIVHTRDLVLRESEPWLSYAAIPLLMVIAGLILARFVAALNESEALHRRFDQRVAASSLELERSFAQLETAQREQALSIERQRIMRDMHDGVGSQLLQAMASIEAEPALRPLAAKLRASLDDLRLVVTSFSEGGHDLAGALATLRSRTFKRCRASLVHCEWTTTGIETDATFSTEAVLQTLRAIQKGVDLALAGPCSRLSVRVWLERGPAPATIEVDITRNENERLTRAQIGVEHTR